MSAVAYGPRASNHNAGILWDALIIGGGPAGAAAAWQLARAGRQVIMVERRRHQDFKLGESIPPQARPLVEHILGARLADAGGYRSYGNVSCWGSAIAQNQDYVFMPNGYGLRLDRVRFDRVLRRRAEAAGACIVTGTVKCRNQSVHWDDQARLWSLVLEHEQSGRQPLRARFVIDCSGRAAVFARLCGTRRQRHDSLFAYARCYRQHAAATPDEDTLTRVEAAPDGWWYSARLPTVAGEAPRRLVVFHTDRDLPAARQAARINGFEALLAYSTLIGPLLQHQTYTALKACEHRAVRGAPAGGERLNCFSGPGWLAAGDAAQAFDPLSSQGIGSALSAGLGAAQAVHQSLNGDSQAVVRYAAMQENMHAIYQRHHAYFYAVEQRWPTHRFWRRRRAVTTPAPARFMPVTAKPAYRAGKESPSCVL